METIVSTDKVRQYFVTRQSVLVNSKVFIGVIASLSDISQALNMTLEQTSTALSILVRLGELRELTIHGVASGLTVYSTTSKLCPATTKAIAAATATDVIPHASKRHDNNGHSTSSSLLSDPNANLRSMVESLERKYKQLETTSAPDDSYDLLAEDLEIFMQQLHDYNEIKDIGQMLLGKLAEFEDCTIKEMHERFALHKEDMA